MNEEIRNRIRLSVAAYAYEVLASSVISDSDFDSLCLKIKPKVSTGNEKLDKFFREEFDPSTGVWIWKHPELHLIHNLYEKVYKR